MLLILVMAMLAGCAMAGAWYGRLQERAWWTRRLIERGINPSTLYPRGSGGVPHATVEPLDPSADAMRDTMEDMAREVQRLAEGQRFLTRVLTEKRSLPSEPSEPSEPSDTSDGHLQPPGVISARPAPSAPARPRSLDPEPPL